VGDLKWSDEVRRAVAGQFFTLFGKLSLGQMEERVGRRLSKQTLSRDREKIARHEAPSQSAAEAYAAAVGRPRGFDIADAEEMDAFVDAVIAARRDYFGAMQIRRHTSSATHRPPRMWPRLEQRIEDRDWTSVIDIIETFIDSGGAEKHHESLPYLQFYLGMAYANLGDSEASCRHFKESWQLIRHTNHDMAMKAHAALEYALALQTRPAREADKKVISMLLGTAIGNFPHDHPPALVNILIAASRMSEGYFGHFSGRMKEVILDPDLEMDWVSLLSTFMEQEELKDYHINDMFIEVIDAIKYRMSPSPEETLP